MAKKYAHPLSPARIKRFMAARSKAIQDSVDIDDLLSEAGKVLVKRIQTRFERKVDATGKPWEESLSSKFRRKTTGKNTTLYDSGNLLRSIRYAKTHRGGLRVFSDSPYAGIHQYGLPSNFRGRTILNVARPFLNVSKSDDVAVFNVMRARLNRRFK